MMSFYSRLADFYAYIFPHNPNKTKFLFWLIDRQASNHILDIGCATGDLALDLGRQNQKVTAVDNDPVMIVKAQIKATQEKLDIDFRVMDMTLIHHHFSENQFQLITCLGNTLVHIPADQVNNLLSAVRHLLKKGGTFVLQVVNYDKILAHQVKTLPDIDNKKITFSRKYDWSDDQHLTFKTQLTIKETNQNYEQQTRLYPITAAQLREFLKKSGFHHIEAYGSYKKEKFQEESPALIIVAS
ncbi:MAG: class I SAM-dependent methyltransferase [Candidatus Cyclobacteriaceae bacterium M3_2C_046]